MKLTAESDIRQLWLMLERNGTHLMELPTGEEPLAAAKEFLETNELSAAGEPFIAPAANDLVFVPVDGSDPDLANFYSWSEVAPGSTPLKEAWRSFLWYGSGGSGSGGTPADAWGINKLLASITLSPEHTAFSVLAAYQEAAALQKGVETLSLAT